MTKTHEEIVSHLRALGIDRLEPGFYDHPRFVMQERQDRLFLEEYARFVATRPMAPDYLERVRREVPLIASIVHSELVADGRLGACIDIGMILSRILEIEGIWNVQVKGSLTINFQKTARLPRQFFWSVDQTSIPFAAAHSWLIAPPFTVIDVALKQQPYRRGREYIPATVTSESSEQAPIEIDRIVSPERLEIELASNKTTLSIEGIALRLAPAWLRMRDVFPAVAIELDAVELIYDTVAVGAPDRPFEEMKNWPVNGRFGLQLYNDLVVPALLKLRSSET